MLSLAARGNFAACKFHRPAEATRRVQYNTNEKEGITMQLDIFGSFFGKVKEQYRDSAREVKLTEKGVKAPSEGIYDNAQWHYKTGFFKKVSKEQGATHIAFFLRWCFARQLASSSLLKKWEEFCQLFSQEERTYPTFVIQKMDGVFSKEDLSPEGQAFADAYYTAKKTDFAAQYGSYIENYADLVPTLYRLNGSDYICVKDIPKNYEKVEALLDQRYQDFQHGNFPPASRPEDGDTEISTDQTNAV